MKRGSLNPGRQVSEDRSSETTRSAATSTPRKPPTMKRQASHLHHQHASRWWRATPRGSRGERHVVQTVPERGQTPAAARTGSAGAARAPTGRRRKPRRHSPGTSLVDDGRRRDHELAHGSPGDTAPHQPIKGSSGRPGIRVRPPWWRARRPPARQGRHGSAAAAGKDG